nr:MATE family efflux transporter [Marinicella rhabdoformis]
MAIPAALGMVFNTLYNLTDNWFAGQISDDALAGLSIASVVFALFIGLAAGLQSGTSAMVAPDVSGDKKSKVRHWVNNATGIALLLSILIIILGLVFGQSLLSVLTESSVTIDLAWQYTWVILLGNLGFVLTNVAAGALMGFGNTQAFRNVLIAGFFVNWLLNPLFIFVLDLGVAGLAWSTVVIKLASAVVLFWLLSKEMGVVPHPEFRWRKWKHLLRQIIPSSANMLTIIVGGFITIYFVGRFGDEAVAGYSVGVRIEQLLLLTAMGLNAAVMAVAGQSYGAKDYQRVKETYHQALKLGFFVSLLAMPMMVFLSPLMMDQFSNDDKIIGIGVYYLRVDALAFFGYVLLFNSVAVLQAIKQPIFPMVIGVLRQMVLPTLANFILIVVLDYDVYAIFWAIVCIVLSSAVLMLVYTERQLRKL